MQNTLENKVIRVYPTGYTGNSIKELNKLLSQGWTVKMVISEGGDKEIINQYVLERIKF